MGALKLRLLRFATCAEGLMTRRRVSTTDRLALFKREGGICHLCKGLIKAGEAWDLSHEIPLALGGEDDDTNWRVAHRKCHREHTATVDVPDIAQAVRREAIHLGAKAPSRSSRKKPKDTTPLRVATGVPRLAREWGVKHD